MPRGGFLEGFCAGAVVLTRMGLRCLLGGVFLAAAWPGHRSAPWQVQGGLGDLRYRGHYAFELGFWLGLGGLGRGWCMRWGPAQARGSSVHW